MTPEEIKTALIEIYKEMGFKLSAIETHDDEHFTFRYKKILYNVNWEDGEEDIYYALSDIEDCEYSEEFLQNEYNQGNVGEFEEFLRSIKEGRWEPLRKVWMALDALEEKFCGTLPQDWDEIIHEKYNVC